MGAELGRKAGVFFLGAAALSMLLPRRARRNEAPAAPTRAETPAPARPPRRMWALVQTRPEVVVLAVSSTRAELERELAELNETWNHWELRTEAQRYVIQPAPVLFPAEPEPGPALPARSVGNAAD